VTAYGALKKVSQFLPGGNTINIIGSGGVGINSSLLAYNRFLKRLMLMTVLGHLVVMYAKAMGYQVNACNYLSWTIFQSIFILIKLLVDISEDKIQLAKESGADRVYNSTTLVDSDITQVSATIVASGAAAAYDLAFRATKNHGRIIAIGVPRGDISVNILNMIKRDLSLIATNQGTKEELVEALDIAARCQMKPVYEMRELDSINEGFQDMLQGKVTGRLIYRMG
jgi:propanol-preferring alcohol dehydrogenase